MFVRTVFFILFALPPPSIPSPREEGERSEALKTSPLREETAKGIRAGKIC